MYTPNGTIETLADGSNYQSEAKTKIYRLGYSFDADYSTKIGGEVGTELAKVTPRNPKPANEPAKKPASESVNEPVNRPGRGGWRSPRAKVDSSSSSSPSGKPKSVPSPPTRAKQGSTPSLSPRRHLAQVLA